MRRRHVKALEEQNRTLDALLRSEREAHAEVMREHEELRAAVAALPDQINAAVKAGHARGKQR